MLSIIIPTTCEMRGLETATNAIKKLSQSVYNRNIEAIVVVDCAGVYQQTVAQEITVLRIPTRIGSYAARNAGCKIAKGEMLIFMDDGVDLAIADTISLDRYSITSGVVEFRQEPNDGYEAWYKNNAFPMLHYKRRFQFLPTIFLAVDRKVFDKIAGFSEDLASGGDVDFCHRAMSASNVSLRVEPNIRIITDIRNKKQIFLKLKRQLYGQLYVEKDKRSQFSFSLWALARASKNASLTSNSRSLWVEERVSFFNRLMAHIQISLFRAIILFIGSLCTHSVLKKRMWDSNEKELKL